MKRNHLEFKKIYGPWAVVAGASEGLGEAFARELAGRGLDLVLAARRGEVLGRLGDELRRAHGVRVTPVAVDLSLPDGPDTLARRAAEHDAGLLVVNAARSHIGPFVDTPLSDHLAALDLNCRAPLVLAHHMAHTLVARGRRGGVLLMSSLAGLQGSALVAAYAASRAFNLVLAEGLWAELRDRGVSVMACAAGATRTPAYLRSLPEGGGPAVKPEMEPRDVAREALDALAGGGHGGSMVPGRFNRLAAFAMQRVLPRRLAVRLMARNTGALYGRRSM